MNSRHKIKLLLGQTTLIFLPLSFAEEIFKIDIIRYSEIGVLLALDLKLPG